ncbi:hypothetical protein PHMEG_00019401 [Phytophthora megakarya]|uniref:Uncharacterized protein n=1 Tax=Phytophthora megakarya TaxID=4795 RepID=A0A225VRN7_9STRA|nr:hypothetical protein PHMEG_00019401 [Phytophthora megakarya]
MLIISMIKERLSNRFAKLYIRCRCLADRCQVQSWCHHYHQHNKVDDKLSSIAMDTHASRQLQRPSHTNLQRRFIAIMPPLHGDFGKMD